MCFPKVVKNLPVNAGDAIDLGFIPRSGGSSGVGNGNSCQYSFLGRGAWQATVQDVAKGLDMTEPSHTHTQILVTLISLRTEL